MASTHRPALVFGGVLGIVHLLCSVIASQVLSEGSWRWLPLFIVDYPFSVFLTAIAPSLPPLLIYGLFGSLWWLFLGYLVARGVQRMAAVVRDRRAQRDA